MADSKARLESQKAWIKFVTQPERYIEKRMAAMSAPAPSNAESFQAWKFRITVGSR